MNIQNLEKKLKDLGSQILKEAEHDQLKTEIALISLESIHTLLVKDVNNNFNFNMDDLGQMNYGGNQFLQNAFQDGPMMGNMQNQLDQFAEPVIYGPSYNNELINQASNIPFLYHNQ